MPTFQYSARDREGNLQQGMLAAETVGELREMLRNKDLFLTKSDVKSSKSADTAASAATNLAGGKRVKLGDMVVMSRQLATLVKSGLPIIEALTAVAAQTDNTTLAATLNQVRLDVLTGASLAGAMKNHPKVFSEVYTALVEAGEASGTLDQTLELAAEQFDQEAELREEVKSAMTYPVIVVIAASLVVVFMLVFVVPAFAKVYTQFKAPLPSITRFMITLSNVVLHYAWLVVLAGVAIFYSFRKWIETPNGKLGFDTFKLKLPVFGKLIRKIAIARFATTLAGATRGGMPILQALQVSANTSGNLVIRNSIATVATYVKEGATLSDPMAQTGEFPPMVTRMIAAGEKSGELDQMLDEVAHFYKRDIEYSVRKLTRMMEPAMTVMVGGIVLFVLVSLYMPIFNLTQVVRR